MAKSKQEIENPVIKPTVIPLRRPDVGEIKSFTVVTRCQTCNERVLTDLDSYIIIDDMYFCCDEHVTDHFIREAGGRRVYGGAC